MIDDKESNPLQLYYGKQSNEAGALTITLKARSGEAAKISIDGKRELRAIVFSYFGNERSYGFKAIE